MGRVEVQPETLRSLAGNLKSVGDNVAGARQGLQGLDDAQTGDGGLSSAVHDFTDKWKYSLEKIGKKADEVGDAVGAAATGYSTTDQGIADAAAGKSQ
jgi:uncharacterized protein YukE